MLPTGGGLSADASLAAALAEALPGFRRLHRALSSAAGGGPVTAHALAAWLGPLPARISGSRAGSHEAVMRTLSGIALLEGEPGGGLGVQGTLAAVSRLAADLPLPVDVPSADRLRLFLALADPGGRFFPRGDDVKLLFARCGLMQPAAVATAIDASYVAPSTRRRPRPSVMLPPAQTAVAAAPRQYHRSYSRVPARQAQQPESSTKDAELLSDLEAARELDVRAMEVALHGLFREYCERDGGGAGSGLSRRQFFGFCHDAGVQSRRGGGAGALEPASVAAAFSSAAVAAVSGTAHARTGKTASYAARSHGAAPSRGQPCLNYAGFVACLARLAAQLFCPPPKSRPDDAAALASALSSGSAQAAPGESQGVVSADDALRLFLIRYVAPLAQAAGLLSPPLPATATMLLKAAAERGREEGAVWAAVDNMMMTAAPPTMPSTQPSPLPPPLPTPVAPQQAAPLTLSTAGHQSASAGSYGSNGQSGDGGSVLSLISASLEGLKVFGEPLLQKQPRAPTTAVAAAAPAAASTVTPAPPRRVPFVTRVSLADLMTPAAAAAGASRLAAGEVVPVPPSPSAPTTAAAALSPAPVPAAAPVTLALAGAGRIELTVEQLIRLVAAAAQTPPSASAASVTPSVDSSSTPLPPLASITRATTGSGRSVRPAPARRPSQVPNQEASAGAELAAMPKNAGTDNLLRRADDQTPGAAVASGTARFAAVPPSTDRAQRDWERRFLAAPAAAAASPPPPLLPPRRPSSHAAGDVGASSMQAAAPHVSFAPLPQPPSDRPTRAVTSPAAAAAALALSRLLFSESSPGMRAPPPSPASPPQPAATGREDVSDGGSSDRTRLDSSSSLGRMLRTEDAEARALASSREAAYEYLRAGEALASLRGASAAGLSRASESSRSAASTRSAVDSPSATSSSARFFSEQAALSATPGAIFAVPRQPAARAAPPSTLRRPRASLSSLPSPDSRFMLHQRLYAGLVGRGEVGGEDDEAEAVGVL